MKRKYSTSRNRLRIIATILALLLMLLFMIPVCVSCDDVIVDSEAAAISTTVEATEVTQLTEPSEPVETTEPTPTEPEWEMIALPTAPEYPDVETLVTIYDVDAALLLCDEFIQEVESIQKSLDPQHPQYGELENLVEETLTVSSRYSSVLSGHWNNREVNLPVMTLIWEYLTTEGELSSEVAAGIIGNMCAESGGCGYSDIDVFNWDNATGSSYYGICQWSVRYHPEVVNTDLYVQLDYLMNTLDYNFNEWGCNYSSRYGSKFRTEQFLSMTDPYEAAIAFAVCYERCSSKHVERRGPLADKVYEYFTVLNSWPWPSPNPDE